MTMISKPRKAIHEVFARFFESPTRATLRALLRENLGEFNHLDFKQAWLPGAKLSRQILGFANSEGGIVVVGLSEGPDGTLTADGLPAFTDKTDLFQSVNQYLPDDLPGQFEFLDFCFTDTEYASIKGKKFQVLIVSDNPEKLPWVSAADGDGIESGVIYVRDGAATTRATQSQLQRLLNRRIATGHSTSHELSLKEHLDELKSLYAEIKPSIRSPRWPEMAALMDSVPNPFYPKEGYETFIGRAIEAKKQVVIKLLSEPLKGG